MPLHGLSRGAGNPFTPHVIPAAGAREGPASQLLLLGTILMHPRNRWGQSSTTWVLKTSRNPAQRPRSNRPLSTQSTAR